MKKGCLILLALLGAVILLVAGGVFAAYKKFDPEIGLSKAPVVSYDTQVTKSTRFQAVVHPAKLVDILLPLLPKEATQQAPLGNPGMIISNVLPYEIALIADPDFKKAETGITVFINEQRGGPFLAKSINEGNGLPENPYIKWSAAGVETPKRGVVKITGSLPIPDTAEAKILELWKNGEPAEQLKLDNTHQVEAVLDNRNGDLLTFIAGFVTASGEDYAQFLESTQMQMGLPLLPGIHDIRLTADMIDADTIKALLRIDSTAEQGPALMMLLSAGWLAAVDAAQNKGLTIEGEPAWDEAKGAILIDMTIKGTKAILEQHIAEAVATLPQK